MVVAPGFFCALILTWIVIFIKRRRKTTKTQPRLIWAMHPLQSNQYWSEALKQGGYVSMTIMKWTQTYQKRSTYDKFCDELSVTRISLIDRYLVYFFSSYIAFTYAVKNFDIFHHHFYGGFLSDTILKKWEAQLIHLFGAKVVITAVGGDFYRYRSLINKSLQTGFLMCYHEQFLSDDDKEWRVRYWTKQADCIMVGFQIDCISRWDVMPFNMVCIDTMKVKPKSFYSFTDGKSEVVTIVHAPNHRGLKGTEFIIAAVNQLKQEGLNINFQLLEGLDNDEVLRIMVHADILVDQLLFGYGLNAIEGMAMGLCVVTNLENEEYTRPFRRFSYLNECPAVSAAPESIKAVLKTLVSDAALRKELGIASRKYAEKYHSAETARYIYGQIYDKIWYQRQQNDLMQIFHPLNPEAYNNKTELIQHPLYENKLTR